MVCLSGPNLRRSHAYKPAKRCCTKQHSAWPLVSWQPLADINMAFGYVSGWFVSDRGDRKENMATRWCRSIMAQLWRLWPNLSDGSRKNVTRLQYWSRARLKSKPIPNFHGITRNNSYSSWFFLVSEFTPVSIYTFQFLWTVKNIDP